MLAKLDVHGGYAISLLGASEEDEEEQNVFLVLQYLIHHFVNFCYSIV